MERDTPRRQFLQQFNHLANITYYDAAYIARRRTTALCYLREELMKARARGIERLEAPDIEDIGPEDIETDPFLRYVLRAGVSTLEQKISEIEKEVNARPDGASVLYGMEFHIPTPATKPSEE